jgi:hypothetical protein
MWILATTPIRYLFDQIFTRNPAVESHNIFAASTRPLWYLNAFASRLPLRQSRSARHPSSHDVQECYEHPNETTFVHVSAHSISEWQTTNENCGKIPVIRSRARRLTFSSYSEDELETSDCRQLDLGQGIPGIELTYR